MQIFDDINSPKIVELLRNGAVGVLRTDTLYGVVCSATNEQSVQRVYSLKGRDETKPPIVLVAATKQLFDTPAAIERAVLDTVWPGPVSVVLASTNAPSWIRRGNNSVAYRIPANDALQQLLAAAGPLIAPSANPQGHSPAMTIDAAIEYFSDSIDFYVDGGHVTDALPSQLIRITNSGEIERLR